MMLDVASYVTTGEIAMAACQKQAFIIVSQSSIQWWPQLTLLNLRIADSVFYRTYSCVDIHFRASEPVEIFLPLLRSNLQARGPTTYIGNYNYACLHHDHQKPAIPLTTVNTSVPSPETPTLAMPPPSPCSSLRFSTPSSSTHPLCSRRLHLSQTHRPQPLTTRRQDTHLAISLLPYVNPTP